MQMRGCQVRAARNEKRGTGCERPERRTHSWTAPANRSPSMRPEPLLMLGVAAHDLPGPLAPSVRSSLRTTLSPSCSTATCTGWLNSTLAMARGCKTELEAVAGALSEDLSADGGGGSNCLTALEGAPDRRRRYRRRRDLPGAPGDLPGRWTTAFVRCPQRGTTPRPH